MTMRFLRSLARTLLIGNNTLRGDEDAAVAHEALHGDSELIRIVRELRELEMELINDTAACR